MKRLTEEEAKMVEDNEKLIYWYAHLKNLDLDEWYGLLAIELCKTVRKYNPTRGGLANYYKLRSDIMVYRQLQQKFRNGEVEEYDVDETQHGEISDLYEAVDVDTVFHAKLGELSSDLHRDVILLKAEGYTQKEIAELLDLTQGGVSWIIKKVREQFGVNG